MDESIALGPAEDTRPTMARASRQHDPVLRALYADYFEATVQSVEPTPAARLDALMEQTPEGSTLMIHDLLNKFTIEDVLGIFAEVGATDLEYVFLPLSTWDTKRQGKKEKRKTRNKAYCFVHFSKVDAAETFMKSLAAYEFPDMDVAREARLTRTKRMTATPAANQGVVPNLLRLVDLPNRKWHPRAGSLCVRLQGKMEHIGVLALREMLVETIGIPATSITLAEAQGKAEGFARKAEQQRKALHFLNHQV